MKAITVQVATLEMRAGDTLAVMVPNRITEEQRKRIKAALSPVIPKGVKIAIFDGGMTIAKISMQVDAAAKPVIPQPAPEGRGHIISLKRRPFLQRFTNSYRLWRKDLGVWASLRAAWVIARA